MTEKQAYQLSLDLWIWLYQNPDKRKSDSPYWDDLRKLAGDCALCDFKEKDYNFFCAGNKDCLTFDVEFCFNGAYVVWVCKYKDFHKTKIAAAYIASKIRRHMRKQGWIERSK